MARRTTHREPTRDYRSPEGRVEIWRHAWNDWRLFLDAAYQGTYEDRDAAEQAAWAWLAEQAQHIEEYA